MNSKGFPYVSSYQSYFSYEANLHLFDPIISDNDGLSCIASVITHEFCYDFVQRYIGLAFLSLLFLIFHSIVVWAVDWDLFHIFGWCVINWHLVETL